VATVFLAERRVEGKCSTAEMDFGIVSSQPWHSEDEFISGGGDVEANGFLAVGNSKAQGIEMGDVTSLRAAAICQYERDRLGLLMTGKGAALRQVRINKATLSSTVYQSSSWDP
jgi:hypothetical protein